MVNLFTTSLTNWIFSRIKVLLFIHGNHEEKLKIKQIRSGNRTKIAKQIILETNGSTTSFLEKQAAEGKINLKKFKNIF